MRRSGLGFKKLDLHIHTPASEDFRGDVTADDIVKKAIEEGLDAIAVTDHNSGAWINCVSQAAKDTGLEVFPGVEISCHGGKGGIHLIALFDVDKDSKHIAVILSKLGISPTEQGDIGAIADSKLGITAIIDIIQDSTWQGIAIPAHVTSDKGILCDMRGKQRSEIIRHPKLMAVEATCFRKENLKREGKRAVDLLDGTDPNYRRKLAVYQASDNPSGIENGRHGLDGIGKRCAFFKMEKINLESLRQCFFDPDVRILQDFEFQQYSFPKIESISIQGGFLGGETAYLSDGLNSILGGKGTGKSLLVEIMRFALNQSPAIEEIKRDHDNKLKHRLGDLGVVQVGFIDETGQPFDIKRTLDPGSNGYEDLDYNPSQICQVLFLSQNEIIRIAEDESLQLDFIDRFFTSKTYEERIEALETSLRDLDKQMAAGLRAIDQCVELRESIATTKVKITRLDVRLDAPIFEQYRVADEKRQALQSQYEYLSEMKQLTHKYKDQVDELELPTPPSALADDSVLKQNRERLDEAKEHVELHINAIIGKLSDVQAPLESDQQILEKSFQQTRHEYLEHVRGEGGDHAKLTREREELQQQLKGYKARLKSEQAKEAKVAEVSLKREKKLNEIDSIYQEWRRARKERCEHFQNSSDGKLELNIHELSDTAEFRSRLLELKRGSNLRDTDIDRLAKSIQPRLFGAKLLDYKNQQLSASPDPKVPLEWLAENADIPLDRMVKLADFLLSKRDLAPVLEFQYKAYPKDRPEIKIRVGSDRYESLDAVSVGQKCTALLIMTLTDGHMPVVIDQPEDSLDIRSIWEDICAKVRHNKNRRQFIFTTHNSSVAVASDTDNFIILEADSDHGSIVFSGSMDSDEVGDQVLKYLEGGTDPYNKKFLKYRAEKRLHALQN